MSASPRHGSPRRRRGETMSPEPRKWSAGAPSRRAVSHGRIVGHCSGQGKRCMALFDFLRQLLGRGKAAPAAEARPAQPVSPPAAGRSSPGRAGSGALPSTPGHTPASSRAPSAPSAVPGQTQPRAPAGSVPRPPAASATGRSAAPAPTLERSPPAPRQADPIPVPVQSTPAPLAAAPEAQRDAVPVPLKPQHHRLGVRDERLMPKLPSGEHAVTARRPSKRSFSREEAARLFSATLRSGQRGLRDLATDEQQLARYGLPVWRTESELAPRCG